MNLGAWLIVGLIISLILTFATNIALLEDKIANIKSELYELEKKIKEYEK